MPARRSRSRRTVALIATATVAGSGVALTAPAIANAAPGRLCSDVQSVHPGHVGDERERGPQPAGGNAQTHCRGVEE